MHFLIHAIFGLALDLFFRRRALGGKIPQTGPLIVVANHPNGIIDPVLVTRLSRRPLRFLAKEPLFRMPVLGAVVRIARALPIYRAKDGHDTAGNSGTFAAVFDALAAGDAICLFPEGISHDESELQPLKTGAARMALGAEAANGFSLGVRIVPVGLIYTGKHTFRGQVASDIGAPIVVSEYQAAYAEQPRAAVLALTADIDKALRKVTVNLSDWADLPLVELCAQLWAEPGDDPATLARLLADGARHLRGRAALEGFRARLEAFGARLDAVGLSADALETRYNVGSVCRFVVRVTLSTVLGLPAALLGAAAYFVPYQTTRLIAARLRPEREMLSSVKLLTAMVLFPSWQIALSITAGLCWGPLALAASLLLPLPGIYTHRFLDHRGADYSAARQFVRVLFRRGDRAALRAERQALRAEIQRLAERYRDEAR